MEIRNKILERQKQLHEYKKKSRTEIIDKARNYIIPLIKPETYNEPKIIEKLANLLVVNKIISKDDAQYYNSEIEEMISREIGNKIIQNTPGVEETKGTQQLNEINIY